MDVLWVRLFPFFPDVAYLGKDKIWTVSHSDDYVALSNCIHDHDTVTRTTERERISTQEILEQADMVLIYLTERYITSTVCLDQLVNIIISKMQNGYKLFPIFSGLDRSQVQSQTSDSKGQPLKPKHIEALRQTTSFIGEAGFNIGIRQAIKNHLKRSGSKVTAGTIKGLIPPADIIKFEAAELPNQTGEGSSSKETQENISNTELEKSCLKHISDASKISPSTLEAMYAKNVLDLSSSELTYLPKHIGKLVQLERLKVSLYRRADLYKVTNEINEIFPSRELSYLKRLKELSVSVDPDCKWWDAEAKAIIDEILGLQKLEVLNFYFPTEDLLKQFLKDDMKVYKVLLDFRLTVGRHDPEIVFCVPRELQREFENSKKCVKYVGGEVDNEIDRVLEHAESLFLDRHWTTKKLSKFNLRNLVCCLLVECNDMIDIFDGSDFDSEEKSPQNMRFLSVHHMEKVQHFWTGAGPIVKGCLEKLEILILHTLPELITIFTPDLLHNLRNLKHVIVKNCPKVTSLMTEDPPNSNSSSNKAFAPNLQIILLVHLPRFTSFSTFLNEAPKLEKVVVYNCRKLKKPSSSDKLHSKFHEIQDGYDWSKEISSRNETEYMHRIFVDLKNQLNTTRNSTYPTTLPKEDARTEDLAIIKDVQMKDLIEKDIFWICGEAGIGKTTMVESVYNSNYDKFEVSCFLPNIRTYSRKPNGLLHLQEYMLASILPGEKPVEDINDIDEGKLRMKYTIKDKKVLIVLDDVDDLSQVEALIGKQDWYSQGSKIIVTVSDKALLKGYEVCNQHEVKFLTDTESRKLFSLHAFGTYKPKTGYEDISMELVGQCGGMPLALVILGSLLCDRSFDDYKTVNEKLKSISHPPQQEDILKVCFDSALLIPDKELFLYIAYFFVGKDEYYVTTILEGCDFHAGVGIRTLAHRCLLTIGRDKRLQMHQLLQDMARKIVQNEKWAKNLFKVWKHLDDVDFHLREKKGLQETQGLIVDLPMVEKSSIETDVFIGTDKLRLLKLNNVKLSGGYANFPNNLVWLSWRGFSLSSLPSDFPMERIVVLDMDYRSLKQIWQEHKFPETLKILNLSHSYDLICTPDFSSLRNLESLILKHCVNLEEVHKSVADLEKIRFLNIDCCKNLKKFPTEIINKTSFDKVFLCRYSLHLIQPQPPAEKLHVCD